MTDVPEPEKEDTVSETSKDGVVLPDYPDYWTDDAWCERVEKHASQYSGTDGVDYARGNDTDTWKLWQRELQLLAALARNASLEAERDAANEMLASYKEGIRETSDALWDACAKRDKAESDLTELRSKLAGLEMPPKPVPIEEDDQ